MADDLMLKVLVEIRDELRGQGQELKSHGVKLDNTNERLDRVVHEQIRHATAIIGLEQGQREIVGELRQMNGRLDRLDNLLTGVVGETARETKARVDNLEGRVEKLERRSG
jgi:hypothetical protein